MINRTFILHLYKKLKKEIKKSIHVIAHLESTDLFVVISRNKTSD